MSYRGFEPNAIGSIVPPFAGGSTSGGGPPPSIADHFAPTIIVGNILAGDPAAPQAAPFQYVGDPGDGTGIAAALASLPIGGWLHIRRGTYTLAPGLLPLTIPGSVRVTGDGVATNLLGDTLDRRVFALTGTEAQLADIRITLPDAAQGATGAAVVDCSTAIRALLENVEVFSAGEILDDINESLTSIFALGVQSRLLKASRALTINRGSGLAIVRLLAAEAVVQSGNFIGANDGIVADAGGGGLVLGNTLASQSTDAIRVAVGASTSVITTNLLGGGTFTNLGGAEAAHNV